ncbi:MAG TPA: prolyl oligopeptidase family serine peptidase [Longimicrobium sp.]|nr:prolyl oligopeptidase family serine peptidase [Longimicrobium sp.]
MRLRRSLAAAAVVALAAPAAARAQQAQPSIAPNENLVVDGIPPIPASLAAEVRRYTESRGASMTDWHPLRREMLIVTRFANTAQLHHVRMPMGARTQLTFFDEPVGPGVWEPRTGRYFLFTKDVGGNEFAQIYRYDAGSGNVEMLTDGGRSQNGGMVWNHAGTRIAYSSTRRNGADRDVYVMDPADKRTDRMVMQVQGGGWGALDWSRDDRSLLMGEYLSVNQSNLYLVDVATGRKTPLTDPRDTAAWGAGVFTADGRSIVATTDQGGEFQRLVLLDVATKRVTPLTTGINWDVEEIDLSPDGSTVAFTTNEAGVSKLRLLTLATRRVRPVTGVPQGVIAGLRWHNNSRDLGFTVSSARSTADVYSLNTATGAVTRWTESELGGLVSSDLVEPRLISWPSFDGRQITGFYYRPPARFTGRRPVIINIHGGPEGQSRPGFLGRNNYFLNEMGVAIIFPNVRGSTGYGKTFVKLDNGMKRYDSVKDIGALLDWIARQPELDASRVMVTGGSYGGFMTLAVATTYNDRVCCSLDVVGISNFNTFLKNTEAYRRDLRRVEYGDERVPEMARFFEQTAPLNNAGKINRPLFVVQGGNDPRVPRTEAEQMVARVKQNGSPVWYLMARDEGHGFRKKANVDYQFYATVMFMRQFLLGQQPAQAQASGN